MMRTTAIAFCLTIMAMTPAMAQSQNGTETGVGEALESLQALQEEYQKQWGGLPGRVVKGAVGLAGVAAALSAAQKAVTFQLRVQGDGSVDSGSTTTTTATSVSTSSSTSTSTSTN
ncbi:MAG: hypothetical protein QF521_14820 [Alphaproteobacteria bacterium]|jgi:hypothetical protein|nr:hypothetical protein [Alphaproteobacteria bacterium]MDP6874797.1 hypothetical protein [Alphaproteobacteria bacterium]